MMALTVGPRPGELGESCYVERLVVSKQAAKIITHPVRQPFKPDGKSARRRNEMFRPPGIFFGELHAFGGSRAHRAHTTPYGAASTFPRRYRQEICRPRG